MKPRLGDDAQDGWLLLGSAGAARANGQALSITGGGASLSAHTVLSAAVVSAALSSQSSSGNGNGSARNQNPGTRVVPR